jgi:tetrahydromethanopterin S-methyltransferase subunit G
MNTNKVSKAVKLFMQIEAMKKRLDKMEAKLTGFELSEYHKRTS